MRRSTDALQRAEDEMRKAVSAHDPTAQQRAANELAEAQRVMNNAMHQQAGNSVADLAQKAKEIADAQREMANRMQQMYGEQERKGGDRACSLKVRTEGCSRAKTRCLEMNDPSIPAFWLQTPEFHAGVDPQILFRRKRNRWRIKKSRSQRIWSA